MMPHFRKQRLGRIVIIGDIYDGADEVLCTAVRFALTGLTKTTSLEGAKYNILCNMVAAPIRQMVQPVEVNILASHVAVLAHHSNTKETGSVFEIDGCHSARLVWQRSPGIAMEPNKTFTAGVVLARWPQYFDFSQATYTSIDRAFVTRT
ncbi:hypothetical protein BJY01DRAFT_224387 [Aspergillus pseudoustus]|uniref:Uncharacterized protein n=1 Tax=Aspergillus pseudoustus TaxID=1810923 RepID=A0ABR4J291_9EURO